MNTKLLNEIKATFDDQAFDLDHEANMVQSRILSPFLELIESKGITQEELEDKTGLSQPFLSALFNIRRNLNMEHIARLQNALGVVAQPPTLLSATEHKNKFYSKNDYIDLDENACVNSFCFFHNHLDDVNFHLNINPIVKGFTASNYAVQAFTRMGLVKESHKYMETAMGKSVIKNYLKK